MSEEWIAWRGGKQPVPNGTLVDITLRGGFKEYRVLSQSCSWWNSGACDSSDIVAYRVEGAQSIPKPAQGAPVSLRPDEVACVTTDQVWRHQTSNTKPSNPKDIVGVRKAPMSTVSGPVLAEIGVGMLEGAAKYGRHNYRIVGVRSSVYYDATMRHLLSWWEGEDIDPESGMSHVAKAITSLVVLRDAQIQGTVTDDRPPSSAEFYGALNKRAGEIIDRHADKSPRHYTIADEVSK